MGGTESTAAVSSVSEAISNVAMQSAQTCEVAASQDQSLNVVNTGFKLWGSYKLEQTSDIRTECFSDVAKQVDLQNKIISAISQTASSSNIALLGAFGKSNATAQANLSNIVRQNITMSNIQRSYTTIKQNQAASFTNSGVIGFEQVELTQGSKIFAAATLPEVDRAGIFNTIEAYVDQTTTASMENPLDFIAKAIGAVTSGITSTFILFIVLVIVAIGGGVYLLSAMGDAGIDIPLPPHAKALQVASRM